MFPLSAHLLLCGALPSPGQTLVCLGLMTSVGLTVTSSYHKCLQISGRWQLALVFPEFSAQWPQTPSGP